MLRPVIGRRKSFLTEAKRVRFGERLRQLRLEKGLTEEQLAERADLTVSEINDMERNAIHLSNPSMLWIVRLSSILGVSVAELSDPAYADLTTQELADLIASPNALAALEARGQEEGVVHGKIPPHDLRKILRHRLRRLLDEP